MTDDFTDYISHKLTQNQKRGYGPAKASTREMHNDRRVIDPPKERGEEELRAARLFLAGLAVDQSDPQPWLAEVLDAMGLLDISDRRRDEEQSCWPHGGTARGYNQHLKTYTRPCASCARVHEEDLTGRMRSLGIDIEGGSAWTCQLT